MQSIQEIVVAKVLSVLELPTTTTITLKSNLVDELGADSLDGVELIMAMEDAFQIVVTDSVASGCKTVGDIVSVVTALITSRGLTLYASHKHVHAAAMTSDLWMDAVKAGGVTGKYNTTKLELGLEGFKVIYNLGTDEMYTSWCPKAEFLKNNTPVGGK